MILCMDRAENLHKLLHVIAIWSELYYLVITIAGYYHSDVLKSERENRERPSSITYQDY